MKIVVLGGTGQLGQRILERLQQDYPAGKIIGTTRRIKEQYRLLLGAKLIAFDPFQDDWTSLGQPDVLVNAIGIIRESAEMDFEKAHLGLTNLILKHRTLLGDPKVIQLSALGADKNAKSRFLKTKALADDLLLGYTNTVVVRPSIVCTPGTMLVRKLQLLGKLCRLGFGLLPFPGKTLQTKIRPIMGEDLAELVSEICRNNNHPEIIEAVGPEEISFGRLLKIVPGINKIIPVPQLLFNPFAPLLTRFFPDLLEKEQLQLMTGDNTASQEPTAKLLRRAPRSTWEFWKREMSIARSS